MTEAGSSTVRPTQGGDSAVYRAFHEYQWDLDKDFLGGLVLALGGYHVLAPTASQADIIMHSRLFYYARVRGVTIPYAGYRQWLLSQYSNSPETTRIWEWHLLRAICNHRDQSLTASCSEPSSTSSESIAREQNAWIRNLLQAGQTPTANALSSNVEGSPAWMTAAPRAELYIDKHPTADTNSGSDQVPYPAQFAAIIKAVQSGEQVEGIVDIPDDIVRKPDITPFGQMERPLKPWEKAQTGQSQVASSVEDGLEHQIESSFPEEDIAVSAKSKS